jgi:hypothetical protein
MSNVIAPISVYVRKDYQGTLDFEAYHLYIKQIGNFLGKQWKADYEYAVNLKGHHQLIDQEKGYIIEFSLPTILRSMYESDKVKMRIRGVFGHSEEDRKKNGFSKRYTDEINVTWSRSTDAIARNIKNRLLPDYIYQFNRELQAHNDSNLRHQERVNKTNQLAAIVGVQTTTTGFIYQNGEIKADTLLHNNDVTMEIKLPVEKARKLLEFMKTL